MFLSPPREIYSRAETRSDAVVHLLGLALVAVAIPALLVLALERRGDAAGLIGVAIYGACLLAMLGFSALYNIFHHSRRAGLLKRLDHCGIYLKIAGTYTPFTLLTGQGLALTLVVWAGAGFGAALKALDPHRFRSAGLALYLGLSWLVVPAGWTMLEALDPGAVELMALGGLLYTLGVPLYLASGLRFHNTLWHVFVLAATLAFYAAVRAQLLAGTPI